LLRNLTADEILEQIVHARRQMHIDRVVFMGMGEPTHNLDHVLAAVVRIRDHAGISPRKQTVSTVGSLRAFERMAQAPLSPCLAVSVHTTEDRLRAELLPSAPREPVAELVAAAERYGRGMGMPVQFEWALLEGVNDGEPEIERLAELLRGVRGYVNVIPYNPVAGAPFRRPPRMRAVQFVRGLKARGVLAAVRWSTASDVDGACGQLRRRAVETRP
jgi:23S rRNA (adenine2503-C2)-methyltransferase